VSGPIAVFVGPSLDWREAREELDALYLPPAEQGSVYNVVRHYDPRAIVLIDGAFGRVPAVRHKELLWALHRRIPVYGAASLGALRAAELAPCGMKGHGLIYRWYRRVALADDEEVAVAMGPAELGAPAVSDALVNIRVTLRRAVRLGIVTEATRLQLVGLARSTPFLERSYDRLFREARDLAPDQVLDALVTWVRDHAIDQKREDALGLLRVLAADPGKIDRDRDALPETQPFPLTSSWLQDLVEAGFVDDLTAMLVRDNGEALWEHPKSGLSL
jgi:hypothetical protein